MKSSGDSKKGHRKGFPAWIRLLIVILGIFAGQAILIGPSLIGKRILLPLALLGTPNAYLPTAQSKNLVYEDLDQADRIEYQEPERIFAAEEVAAGRFPLWTPHRFGGAPLYMLSFSPLWIPGYLVRSPVVLAWIQMLIAMTAGLGMYVFVRRVVHVSFWPSAIVAWCYPLTGAFIVWEGWYLPSVVCWLPWMLVAVDWAIRRPTSLGGPAVGLITAILLVSGAQDVAGQVLLASGIFAVWCFFDCYGLGRWPRRRFLAVGVILAAWGAGIAGSAWLMLPFHEYVQTSIRMQDRSAGIQEERPPVGLSALPPVVLPAMNGASLPGSVSLSDVTVPESTVAGYAGLMATLLFAPLALGSRRHRSINVLLLILLFFSLSWALNVPGMVWILRLPVLNMMSHNRLVFLGSLAILALAAIGLERVMRGEIRRRWWFEVLITLLVLVGGWAVYRTITLPHVIATDLGASIAAGKTLLHVKSAGDVDAVQFWFREHYAVAAAMAILSLAGWHWIRARGGLPRWAVAMAGLLMGVELLYFGFGRLPQADPALYFPPLSVVDQIKKSDPGRIMGFACLYPNFAQAIGLDDVRGFDGIDPRCMVELVSAASLPPSTKLHSVVTFFMAPVIRITAQGAVKLSPILSMLGVRYVLLRDASPPAIKTDMHGDDYWVLVNHAALPRAFVPQRVEVVPDSKERLAKLSREDFDPAQVAYVEAPVHLPDASAGTATIERDIPTEVTVKARMQNAGLLVLADNWDAGWVACVNGKPEPILRVNHAVRGVVLAAGESTVDFRFAPPSLRLGLWISGAAGLLLAAWSMAVVLRRRLTPRGFDLIR